MGAADRIPRTLFLAALYSLIVAWLTMRSGLHTELGKVIANLRRSASLQSPIRSFVDRDGDEVRGADVWRLTLSPILECTPVRNAA